MTPEERERDYLLSCALATAIAREKGIREGKYTPRLDDPDEMRWSIEGVVPDDELDARLGR